MFSVAFVCLFVCLSICPDDNSKMVIDTSADEIGEVMFSVAFVCLSVCLSDCLSVCLFVRTITQKR